MAASVVGVVVGGLIVVVGVVMWLWARGMERRQQEMWAEMRQATGAQEHHQPLLSDEVTARLVERLLDAALPGPRADEPPLDRMPTDAEYEPPIDPVRDWTDPFFGMERPLVGGLAPGQGIPGIGQQADADEWGGDETQAYVEDMQEQVERDRALGEALFNDWDAQRGGMPR